MNTYRIVITPGEPAGIGPDLVVLMAQLSWPVELVVCADPFLLKKRADLFNLTLNLISYNPQKQPVAQRASTLTILPINLIDHAEPGELNVKNSYYVIKTLKRACKGCLDGEFSALVTGPVHKGIINQAGIPFVGHTEYLATLSSQKQVVMLMLNNRMRIALATTHLPISDVSKKITKDLLRDVIKILSYNLHNQFNIDKPYILVCGLNPHAGEGGYIGTEEIDIIIPVITELRKTGIHISNPIPADTIFQSKYLNKADAILSMYHDQCLPVLKSQNFGYGVNTTLGLPFIRTSVDHGTALSLAGKKNININSFIAAINLAIKLIYKSI